MAQDQPRKKPGPAKGQLYKFDESVLEKLRQAFAIDATIEEACFYADIDPKTYYNWKNAKPEQFQKLEQLRNTPILAARQTLANAVKTDHAMALKYLERKRKAEFALRNELTGADGKELPTPIMSIDAIPRNNSNKKDS